MKFHSAPAERHEMGSRWLKETQLKMKQTGRHYCREEVKIEKSGITCAITWLVLTRTVDARGGLDRLHISTFVLFGYFYAVLSIKLY